MDFTGVKAVRVIEGNVVRILDSAGDVLWGAGGGAAEFTPLEITTTSLPDGKLKTAYSVQLTYNGTALTWSRVNGAFPPGLAINTSGVISDEPTKAGKFTFTIKAVNKTEHANKTLTLTVTK